MQIKIRREKQIWGQQTDFFHFCYLHELIYHVQLEIVWNDNLTINEERQLQLRDIIMFISLKDFNLEFTCEIYF